MIMEFISILVIFLCLYFFFLNFYWKKHQDKKLLTKYEEGIKNGTIKEGLRELPKGFDTGFDFGTAGRFDKPITSYERTSGNIKSKGRSLFQIKSSISNESNIQVPIPDTREFEEEVKKKDFISSLINKGNGTERVKKRKRKDN